MKHTIHLFILAFFPILLHAQTTDSTKKDKAFIYSMIINSVPDHTGLPLIGFINHTRGDASSANIGFINLVNGSFNGSQIGFVNTAGKDLNGAQIGFVNLVKDSVKSAQIGFINASGEGAKGAKIGFINATAGDMKGATIGYVNATSGNVTGPQIGFVNISRKAKGLSIGFVNIIDSLENGVPIGFLSFVRKNGFHSLEISANEIFPVNAAYKVGARRLYSILQVSTDPFSVNRNYGFSLGLGTNIAFSSKAGLAIEASVNSRRDKGMENQKFYYYERLSTMFTYKAGKSISLVAGPSLGYYAQSRYNDTFPDKLPKDFVLAEGVSFKNFYQLIWLGGQAGIRINLTRN